MLPHDSVCQPADLVNATRKTQNFRSGVCCLDLRVALFCLSFFQVGSAFLFLLYSCPFFLIDLISLRASVSSSGK